MAVKWKWKPAAGGSVPAGLEQKVNQLETNYNNLNTQAVKISGDQSIAGVKTFTGGLISRSSTEFGTEIKAGYGGTEVYFTPEDTSTKTLKYGRSGSGRFNIDLENQSQLTGIKDPTADYHASNKQYVDNRIKKRIIDRTITAGNSFVITPTQGYEIVNVMVGRKRSSDGYYFFQYQSSLNFQLFFNTSNQFSIYTEGPVSGFTGDYRIVVFEMKV